MTWMTIVATIVQALMPLLQQWLDSLLKQAAADLEKRELQPVDLNPYEGVKTLFAVARARMTVWQWFWYGGALNRYERVMLRKAYAIWNLTPVSLTLEEIDELS